MRNIDGGAKGPLDRLRASLAPSPREIEALMQQEKVRTIHYGIGSIGAEVVRTMANSLEIEIVGAIDANPAKAGKDLGEAAGVGHSMGVQVSYEAEPVLRDVYADVVVHCTGSSLTEVFPQLMDIVAAEKSVVSSCEELSFPWMRYSDIAQKLDRRAREAGVRVLGTGVNPGFVMDFLPLVLATASQQVRAVRVSRVVDISTRRIQLQRKAGAGLSVMGFREGASGGSIGHVGLRESALMIADTFGWKLDDFAETLEPVVAQDKLKTDFFSIERGYVSGLRQSAVGLAADQEVVRLDLEMSLGAKNPQDVIEIDGRPPIKVVIPGGVSGDLATASIMANCVPAVARSRSVGLISMRDLPLIPYYRPRTSPQREPVE